MSKAKGPKFKELPYIDVETRHIEVLDRGFDYPSSRYIMFDCPYCQTYVKAFVWSLAGGGKRCDCGALFTGISGNAVHFKNR